MVNNLIMLRGELPEGSFHLVGSGGLSLTAAFGAER